MQNSAKILAAIFQYFASESFLPYEVLCVFKTRTSRMKHYLLLFQKLLSYLGYLFRRNNYNVLNLGDLGLAIMWKAKTLKAISEFSQLLFM